MAGRSSPPTIWVLPNRRTPGLVAVLVAMWYAGASQGNGAAYLLCFVLASLGLVSAVHAWTNLRGIELAADHLPPTFAGEETAVSIVASSTQRRPHFALHLRLKASRKAGLIGELPQEASERVEVSAAAMPRGRYDVLTVTLKSSYPLGFCTAQQERLLEQRFYVYPAPSGEQPLPLSLAPTRLPRSGSRSAGDDYGGVRAWQQGESQRHIDWKAAARGQTLLTKQWTGEVDEVLRLDWHGIIATDLELKLSQLARWVILAERGTSTYALHLPGKDLPASRGHSHYHACLRALAEFPAGQASPQV